MLVKDLMRRKVTTVSPGASLVMAARKMRDAGVGCLPVLEDGRLIGMLTDRDIVLRGIAEGLDPDRASVREVMSDAAVACSADQRIDEAQELMARHRIQHLPVLDRRARVVGLVAIRDLTGQFARCKPHQVTFYKQLTSSSGRLHDVEVGKVYLSPAVRKDEAVAAALARFADDRGLARWDQAADGYALHESG